MKKRYFNMIPSPDTACILLYGEIGGFDGISDKDIVAELYEYASMYKSIDIRVNSPGGSVYAGMSIFNALRSSEADITIYVDGIAASMASIIALCGKPVYMSQYARLMLHAPYGGCYGNKEELRAVSDELASLEDTLADMYASRLGKTREEIKDTYFDGKDHWITAKEAKEMGLVDGIYDIKEKVDAQSPQDIYAVFQARLNSQSFNTHNNMYEELRKRPSFAACATDEDVVRMLASLENKAGQYDAVVKERNELKRPANCSLTFNVGDLPRNTTSALVGIPSVPSNTCRVTSSPAILTTCASLPFTVASSSYPTPVAFSEQVALVI